MRPIAVFGPTASGKSALGLALAQELGGEVVNVDSMQLYRGMDIGTAKITAEEMPNYVERVTRRFAAERTPGESFATWAHRADEEALR